MLGEALRLIRVFHDKKLTELASELDLSASYLSEIENQKKAPSIELVERYARAFETTPSAILFFSEQLDKNSERSVVKKNIRASLIKFLQVMENATKDL